MGGELLEAARNGWGSCRGVVSGLKELVFASLRGMLASIGALFASIPRPGIIFKGPLHFRVRLLIHNPAG